jgi:hypothetical protein
LNTLPASRTGTQKLEVFPMTIFRTLRVMVFALFLGLIPASSWAGVLISVGFAPPVLPVYVQPQCPQPGWMWAPGYWAYGPDGYYWVPGTWVPAPYVGALWTPPYWGWSGGLYVFHTGYWGPHVGYYGGVDYGFGYMGIGFAGGAWRGNSFAYNTAVMHVNTTVIHNTYDDRTVVRNNTIANDRHVAYSGGPGGINHPPTAQETAFSHEQHRAATSMQTQNQSAAMHDTNNYASHNGGHPRNVAMTRPMGDNPHPSNNNNFHQNTATPNRGHGNAPAGTAYRQNPANQPAHEMNQGHQPAPQVHESRPAPQMHESRPAPQMHESRPAPQVHESRPAPQMHESRPAPQVHESRPAPQMHESHSAPAPHEEHGHR